MKLYTEEQVRQAMQESRYAFSTGKGYDEILNSLTTIELPIVCDENELDCPYEFTSRCTMGRCDCKPKQTNSH